MPSILVAFFANLVNGLRSKMAHIVIKLKNNGLTNTYLVVFDLNETLGLISYFGVPIRQQCTCLDRSLRHLLADRWQWSRQNPNPEARTDESEQCRSHRCHHLKFKVNISHFLNEMLQKVLS